MRTLRAALLGLVLTLSAGAASASASWSTVAKASAICKPGTIGGANPCTPAPLCPKGVKTTNAKPCNTIYEMAIVKQLLRNAALREVAPIQIDPSNIGERPSKGAVAVLTVLDSSRGLFRLSVTNTSGLAYINAFTWHAPAGMTITAIRSSYGGTCSLVRGIIRCRAAGTGIAPVKGPFEDGGRLTVDFVADGVRVANTSSGVTSCCLKILMMTRVPYHIGPFIPESIALPLCKSGQTSTQARPCSKR